LPERDFFVPYGQSKNPVIFAIQMIRQLFSLLPASARRAVRLTQRKAKDRYTGQRRYMVSRIGPPADSPFPIQHTVVQRITPSTTQPAKLHNLRKGIARLHGIVLPPGYLLSFWHVVGRAGRREGYQPSRNIINGRLTTDFGGGLCQLSSAMYELALMVGLEIMERHAHSTNVYTPETTYTPLGLDATIAYGYKDLRIRNNGPHPVCFTFDLQDTHIRVMLCAPAPLPNLPLRVSHDTTDTGLVATVYRTENGGEKMVSMDRYRNPKKC
jgi:vancomycin resistance protein VanW